MFTFKIKAVVLLLTSMKILNLPNFSNVEISVSPLSSLLPFSSSESTDNFSLQVCVPDLTLILNEAVSSINEESYMNCWQQVLNVKNATHPDIGKTTPEIITSYGYPVEIHEVTTKDEYILTVHRIPRYGKTPVHLQHGFAGCSDNWLFQYRDKSLAFLLWEAGYDVWIGNFRGTDYSLGHVSLAWDNPKNYSYWDFSWHENGVYDVPAMVDLVLRISGRKKLVYIGHSMGAQSYLIALDLVPEMNEKIEVGILLAPGGFLGRSPNPLRIISPIETKKEDDGRIDEPRKMQEILGMICAPTAIRCMACAYPIFAIFGMDAPRMNYTIVPNLISRYPHTFSLKTIFHYAQGMNECGFRQYDYGREKNMEIYNRPIPPEYSLKNVKAKTYAFHGPDDNVFVPEDVQRTLNLLPAGTLIQNIVVNSTYFNHADFLIAKDANSLVYWKILTIIKENMKHIE